MEKSTLSANFHDLTLQPLVENAIIYTIENTADYCSIQMKSKTPDHNKIIIDVVNSNSQFPPDILANSENNKVLVGSPYYEMTPSEYRKSLKK